MTDPEPNGLRHFHPTILGHLQPPLTPSGLWTPSEPESARAGTSKQGNPYVLLVLGVIGSLLTGFLIGQQTSVAQREERLRGEARLYIDSLGSGLGEFIWLWQMTAASIESRAPRDSVVAKYTRYATRFEALQLSLTTVNAHLCARFGPVLQGVFSNRVQPAIATLVDTLRLRTRVRGVFRARIDFSPLVMKMQPVAEEINDFLLFGWRLSETSEAIFSEGACWAPGELVGLPTPSMEAESTSYNPEQEEERLKRREDDLRRLKEELEENGIPGTAR